MNVENGTVVLRYLSSALLQHFLVRIAWVMGGIAVCLVGLIIILGLYVSHWWFVLLVIVLPAAFIGFIVFGFVWFASKRLAPRKLTRADRKKVARLADKALGVIARLKTPYPLLAIVIARDVVQGRSSSFVKEIVEDSKQLREEYAQLQDSTK